MFLAKSIAYKDTGYFSRIILDYLEGNEKIREFYSFGPNEEGIAQAIAAKKNHKTDRSLLVSVFRKQYPGVDQNQKVFKNIESLLSENTFTICTAHQPNLFTGPLYFIYKILHAIKLADHCKNKFPGYEFVPVYYMGSEDADLEELNHFVTKGKYYEWNTAQSGAVGRMRADADLLSLITELEKQIGVEPYGDEVITLLRKHFVNGKSLMQCTKELVDELFGSYGLLVLIPDDAGLKSAMRPVFEDDLFRQVPSKIVRKTCDRLSAHYNVQAQPREINLFYLEENIRERFDLQGERFVVNNSELSFSHEEIKKLLEDHPEVFSPNVILRGLFQETILPNLVFIGGGGEIAYWLQLKELFEHYSVPFPMLVVRNSFLLADKKWVGKINQTGFDVLNFFLPEKDLADKMVSRLSENEVTLNGSYKKTEELFREINERAGAIDVTLNKHVGALQQRSLKYLKELEKKMLRAEKRKHADKINQLKAVKNNLFPKGSLQERVENFSGFYAQWGKTMIENLYNFSPVLEQQFTILEELDQSK
jgi:bacillithiol synthase